MRSSWSQNGRASSLSALYLACLVVSIVGCLVTDIRYKLAIAVQTRRTLLSIGFGVVFFVIWDLVGVQAGIFFRGESKYLLGFEVAPQIPVEELFFLTLLCYCSLLSFLALGRLFHRARDKKAGI